MIEATPVVIERTGSVGYLSLDKPKALNALDLPMVRELHRGLKQHIADAQVQCIVIRSSGDRAFCAGGNMKLIRELVMTDQHHQYTQFFTEEYALNLAIANCPKPYIAILDGVAMGGGLGISIHGSHRIVTEHARLAMPETRIGLFPDVGGTYFLPRLPSRAGWWLAMTSTSLLGEQAVHCGLATHYVQRSQIQSLCQALENAQSNKVDSIIESMSSQPHEEDDASASSNFKKLCQVRALWFSEDNAAAARTALLAAINTENETLSRHDDRDTLDNKPNADTASKPSNLFGEDAKRLLGLLDTASPYAIRRIEKLFVQNKDKALDQCLQRELASMQIDIQNPDFIEGIRAVLVDKDHSPRWQQLNDDFEHPLDSSDI